MSSNQSDVARLREQIEREYEAMQQVMYGPAMVARHDIISHSYKAVGTYQHELASIVGNEQATDIMCQAYYQVIEQEGPQCK
jgi:hypothetical protein